MIKNHGLRPRAASRALAVSAAAALSFSLLPAGMALGQETQAQPEGRVDLQADDATGASLEYSQLTFDSAEEALVGRDDLFADNLASGALQQEQRPLLLTDSDDLEDEVAQELERLGVDTVHVLGGTEAISEDVVDELEAAGYTVNRFSGPTRIETSIDITESLDTDTAIVARSEGEGTQAFADSLAAGAWAAEAGYGLLLNPSTFVAETIADFLEGGEIQNLIIVGGTQAISQDVMDELEGLVDGDVRRVAGTNRFETAVAIAEERGADDAGDAGGVILVEGDEDDAWASGFSAAATSAIYDLPIVLADNDDLPPATETYLEGGDATTALVCGPFVDNACDEAATILGAQVAVQLLNVTFDEDARTVTGTITGAFQTVAVSGDCVAATTIQPDDDDDDDDEQQFELQLTGQTGECELTFEVTEATGVTRTRTATVNVTVPPTNQTLAVSPAEAATNTVSENDGLNNNRGARSYTVSGLDNNATYHLELHEAEDVTEADTIVSFQNNTRLAATATSASFEVVNGAAVGAAGTANATTQLVDVQPVNGNITFTIDSVSADEVIPVVYRDADDDNVLDLAVGTAPTAPTEDFGVGGQKTWVPSPAETGALAADEEIVSVDKDADRIVTANATYSYDANDVFYVIAGEEGAAVDETADACGTATARVTLSQFESQLTAGDELDASTFFQANAELPSEFCLENLAPGAPTIAGGVVTAGERSVTADVQGIAAGAEVTIKVVADADDCDDPAVATFTTATDEDPTVGDFQISVAGLQPTTDYEVCIRQTIDGEVSDWATVAATTAADTPPALQTATANDINDGVGSTNQVRFNFDEQVTVVDATQFTVSPQGQPFTLTGTSATVTANGLTVIVTLDGTLNDAPNAADVIYDATAGAGAVRDAGGQANDGSTQQFSY